MSTLRKQLDQLKAQHDAARYPGDLAAEVMSPLHIAGPAAKAARPTTNRLFWALGSSSAIAASLLVGFLLTARSPSTPTTPVTAIPNLSASDVAVRSVDSDRNLAIPDIEGPTSPVPYSIDLASAPDKSKKVTPGNYTPR